jgi:hypothetical protein
MMRAKAILVGLVVLAAACGGKTSPTPSTGAPNTVIFTAALSPANEVPPLVAPNPDVTGSGTATITLNLTRDSGGAITAATVTFQISLTGFPNNTNLTAAHIHEGASNCACPVKVSTTLANGELVLANGTGGFTKAAIATTADVAQGMINNPAGYYFNVHTTANTGGAARGVLVKQ